MQSDQARRAYEMSRMLGRYFLKPIVYKVGDLMRTAAVVVSAASDGIFRGRGHTEDARF